MIMFDNEPLQITYFSGDSFDPFFPKINFAVSAKKVILMDTEIAIFGITQTGIDRMISCGLGLPTVITVVYFDEFHILKIIFGNFKIVSATPASHPPWRNEVVA